LLLHFEGLQIAVHSGSRDLLRQLEEYFAPFVLEKFAGRTQGTVRIFAVEQDPPKLDLTFRTWPREPGKERLKEEVATAEGFSVVRKVRTGMQFLSTQSEHMIVGPCLDNVNQVVNFVGSCFMTHCMHRGWQLCHAAGVANDAGGLAIAGLSGGGKSTLALHLITSGLDYVSNDRLLIQDHAGSADMLGVPKLPRINPGTAMHNDKLHGIVSNARLQHLQTLSPDQLWNLEEKYDVDIHRHFGANRMRRRAPLRGVVILNWSRQVRQTAQMRPVSLAKRPDLLRALTKAAGPFYQTADVGPADGLSIDDNAYLEALQQVTVFEMTGGVDFAEATRECNNLLLERTPIRA
jgi:HprK-related kinase B